MKKSAKVAIAGAILFVGSLLLGVAGTVAGMIRVFNSAAESSGTSAEELAEGISNSLISTAVGIPLALVGLCLLVGGGVAYFAGGRKKTTEEQLA
jgi:hypothetical protein